MSGGGAGARGPQARGEASGVEGGAGDLRSGELIGVGVEAGVRKGLSPG